MFFQQAALFLCTLSVSFDDISEYSVFRFHALPFFRTGAGVCKLKKNLAFWMDFIDFTASVLYNFLSNRTRAGAFHAASCRVSEKEGGRFPADQINRHHSKK
jgi:hypothetical protein